MASVFKREADKGVKGSKWIACWYDTERDVWRQTTAYTDRGISVALAQRLEHDSALRREGFTSNVREQSVRPVLDQLDEYITHVVSGGGKANYVAQLNKRIRRVLAAIKATRLLDVDPGKVQSAMLAMRTTRGFEKEGRPLSVATRNEYLNSLMCFTRWATGRRKLEHDPLACLSQADEVDADKVHPRRALTVAQVAALLDAALRRPEVELLTVRTGKRKGEIGAQVRANILARARQTGVDRRMAYLLAVWTGLRRSELGRLEWRDVHLDAETPYVQLRAEITKAGRDDVLPLHPQMTAELRAYRPASTSPTDRVVPTVPDMNVMKRDLKFAEIEYGDREIGFADLHAQRMTLNTMLASQGVESRVRQAQLRHTDPRLTEDTYFDKSLFVKPQAEKLGAAADIPTNPRPFATDTPSEQTASFSQLVHENGVSSGQFGALAGTDGAAKNTPIAALAVEQTASEPLDFVVKRHDPASRDAGSFLKRATGLEPATFTLAT